MCASDTCMWTQSQVNNGSCAASNTMLRCVPLCPWWYRRVRSVPYPADSSCSVRADLRALAVLHAYVSYTGPTLWVGVRVPGQCFLATHWFALVCVQGSMHALLGPREYAVWAGVCQEWLDGVHGFFAVGASTVVATIGFGVDLGHAAATDVLPKASLARLAVTLRPTCATAFAWSALRIAGIAPSSPMRDVLAPAAVLLIQFDVHFGWLCRGVSSACAVLVGSGFAQAPVCALLGALACAYPSFPAKPKLKLQRAPNLAQTQRATAARAVSKGRLATAKQPAQCKQPTKCMNADDETILESVP